jgi:hypothetical protein
LKALALLVLAGCPSTVPIVGPDPTPSPTPAEVALVLPDGATLGDEVVCADPHEAFDRLSDETAARGLDVLTIRPWAEAPSPPAAATVVARDLDDDGDVDVLLPIWPEWAQVLENDGTGHFTDVGLPDPSMSTGLPPAGFFAAVDLDGDRLPEMISTGDGYLTIQRNLGGLSWGPVEVVHRDLDPPIPRFMSFAFGDLDGDGDLDLALPAVHEIQPKSDNLPPPHPDLLFRNDGGTFVLDRELTPDGEPGHAQAALFTDRDRDGDLDLFIPSEFGRESKPSAFFRNDGVGSDWVELTNDAEEIGADLRVGAMGMDATDLNDDGFLDYCVSDFGPVRCLISDPLGYVDGAAARGLTGPPNVGPGDWSSWGVELVDLDHDGSVDAVVAAGEPDVFQTGTEHIDMIFQGDVGTFVDRTDELGVGDPAWHYGLAASDFDGDGFRDLLYVGYDAPPKLLMNRCGAGAWLEVDADGSDGNRESYGALIEVEAGGRARLRELQNLRAFNQTEPSAHFGLGDVSVVDRVTITWPDGEIQVAEAVPVNRRLRFSKAD